MPQNCWDDEKQRKTKKLSQNGRDSGHEIRKRNPGLDLGGEKEHQREDWGVRLEFIVWVNVVPMSVSCFWQTYGDDVRWSHQGGWMKSLQSRIVLGIGMVVGGRIDCKGAQGNFLGWYECYIFWLWWWLHRCIYLSKLFKLYILNNFIVCKLCL